MTRLRALARHAHRRIGDVRVARIRTRLADAEARSRGRAIELRAVREQLDAVRARIAEHRDYLAATGQLQRFADWLAARAMAEHVTELDTRSRRAAHLTDPKETR